MSAMWIIGPSGPSVIARSSQSTSTMSPPSTLTRATTVASAVEMPMSSAGSKLSSTAHTTPG